MTNVFMKIALGLALFVSIPLFIGASLDDSAVSIMLFVVAVIPWFIAGAWIVIHFSVTVPEEEIAARKAAKILAEQEAKVAEAAKRHAREVIRYRAENNRADIFDVMMESTAYSNVLDRAIKERASYHGVPVTGISAWEQKEVAYEALAPYLSFDHKENNGNQYIHFIVPTGETDADIMKMAPALKAALNLYEIDDYDYDDRSGFVSFYLHRVKKITILDRLVAMLPNVKFFNENPAMKDNPAKDIFKLPLGVTATGKVWFFSLAHSIVIGKSGSGKGSFIQGIIRQLAPFAFAGYAKMWFIDPKGPEVKPYRGSKLIHRIAMDSDEIAAAIHDFAAELERRKQDAGRENKVSRKTPANVLLIDEFPAVIHNKQAMAIKDDNGRTAAEALEVILLQGRFLSFFIVAAAQGATKDFVGDYPKNMMTKVALSLDSLYEVAKTLGVEQEVVTSNPNAVFPIPESVEGNGYKYSGIANAKSETGGLEAIRLAYLSTEDIHDLVDEYDALFAERDGLSHNENEDSAHAEDAPAPEAPIVITNTVEAPTMTISKSAPVEKAKTVTGLRARPKV
jgi:hypothetical protein